jgi:1,4-alpha-glucan branching enzyme
MSVELEDPYRFPPVLTDYDLYLLGEGTHQRVYDKLGAHPMTLDGVEGVGLRGAGAECAAGQRGRRFQLLESAAAPDAGARQRLLGIVHPARQGRRSLQVRHHRPARPAPADEIRSRRLCRRGAAEDGLDRVDLGNIAAAAASAKGYQCPHAPISIYEVHLGSWRRKGRNRWLSYRELAEQLPAYARDMGFTHVELLPVSEHPFDGSWGYQPTGLFAPTSRFGSPADFVALVDACHGEGLGVLLDWVPGHFPDDPHGLGHFDGTALYEHANPEAGPASGLGHADLQLRPRRSDQFPGLQRAVLAGALRHRRPARRCGRLHALSRLLAAGGGWIPNQHGGRENLEAIAFIRRFNTELYARFRRR